MSDIDRAIAIAEREPLPTTWAEQLDRAREVVREVGDLPESVAYDMLMRSPGEPGVPSTDQKLADLESVRPPNAPARPASTERV